MTRRDPRDAAIEADEASRFGGKVQGRRTRRMPRGRAVYLVTSAQNNTRVHAPLWNNLLAYARYLGAELLVSQFVYNKAGYIARGGSEKARSENYDDIWYDAAIEPHLCNDSVQLAPGLIFCGEANILPTATRPISGFENYTGRASTILPHARQELQSVASLGPAKLIYTTGTATLRNYLQKRVGLVAEHYHAYGALIVEVDADGRWFVRQLRATEDGAFQDLDVVVSRGRVTTGNRVEGISYGDIHVEEIDPIVRAITWGAGGIADTLRPRYQFFHDLHDHYRRNHHELRNPHAMFRRFVDRQESVEDELRKDAEFLKESLRPWSKSIVVGSNHNEALDRWLREVDFRADPVNAQFYLKAQAMVYADLVKGRAGNVLAALLYGMGVPRSVRFLDGDESFVTCRKAGGIEHIHGHDGPNGARGTPRGFERLGRRTTTGHTHVAGIVGDVVTSGTSSKLRLAYNRGASSWTHSHTIEYPNGCRAVITLIDGRWRGAPVVS
jgi:hypothetical protein